MHSWVCFQLVPAMPLPRQNVATTDPHCHRVAGGRLNCSSPLLHSHLKEVAYLCYWIIIVYWCSEALTFSHMWLISTKYSSIEQRANVPLGVQQYYNNNHGVFSVQQTCGLFGNRFRNSIYIDLMDRLFSVLLDHQHSGNSCLFVHVLVASSTTWPSNNTVLLMSSYNGYAVLRATPSSRTTSTYSSCPTWVSGGLL